MTLVQATVLHAVFEWAAVFVGVRLYLRNAHLDIRRLGATSDFAVVFGCVAGAALGSKAVHWLQHAESWPVLAAQPWLLVHGQSIVGGLLGGLLGVEIGKRAAGVRQSTGDRFVVPILAGLLIGRVGCFLAGLYDDTYGNATTLPWGWDFGDGVRRHPTQLYDMVFAAVAWAALTGTRRWLAREPGLRFKLLLTGYLGWRLVIEALKPVPHAFVAGLSGIQLVCIVGLVAYLPFVARAAARIVP